MSAPTPSLKPDLPKPWQPRFGIAAMMLVMLVFCVLAAGVGYLVRGMQSYTGAGSGRPMLLIFLLFTLAGPMLLMVVVSIIRALTGFGTRRRRRK